MPEDRKPRGGLGGIGDGLRTGIGILSAFKEAVEETLQDLVDRGDLSPERARQAMRDAAQRVQSALEETKERMDFASERDVDELRQEVAALRERVARLEGAGGGGAPTAGEPGGTSGG